MKPGFGCTDRLTVADPVPDEPLAIVAQGTDDDAVHEQLAALALTPIGTDAPAGGACIVRVVRL